MGLFSKLFKSNTADPAAPSTDEAHAESSPRANVSPAPERPLPAELIVTPQAMQAPALTAPRPTPTDVFDRATVPHLEPLIPEERPTVLALECPAPDESALDVAAAARPQPPIAKAQPRAPSPERAPLVPRPALTPSKAGPARAPAARKPPPPPLPPPAPRAPSPAVAARMTPPTAVAARMTPPTADDLDAGFAAIERKSDRPAGPGTFQVDLAGVRSLFAQLAINHLRQVRDFMIELRWGPTPTTWVAVCGPSVESLRRAAEGLEFTELANQLQDFAKAMQMADVSATTTIDGAGRERILAAHAALAKLLPETFALDGDRSQREAAIVHALLSQIPDVGKVTIDKLYAAGLSTLETMLLATAEDVSSTTGISEVLAARIVERFRLYREEMATAVDETRAHERSKIAALVDQLRTQNEEFAQAAAAWTEEAVQRKKDVLLSRTQTMLEIDLQLARLGEIALVRELERLPFARKLAPLEAFLTRAEEIYAARPRASASARG